MFREPLALVLALVVASGSIEIGAAYIATGQFGIGRTAEARVGRPLTPVSVAGVGRRTVRRCAVGAYNC